MSSPKLSHLTPLALAMGSIFATMNVSAVTPADAQGVGGAVFSTTKPAAVTPPKADPQLTLPNEQRPPLRAPSDMKVPVKAFRISGAKSISEAQLQGIIAAYTGKQLSIGDMERAAADLTQYYRSQGYILARAYLPAQDINQGTVEIAILEGVVGKTTVNTAAAPNVNPSLANRLVQSRQKTGTAVKEQDVERGLLLLNDLPGVAASAELSPGANTGETQLTVTAKEEKRFGGSVEADNHGNQYAGQHRVGASVYANNLSGYGDQLSAKAMVSDESLGYGRIAYNSAVGGDGLRVGVAQTHLTYKLGGDFKVLDASGTVDSTSAFATYPIVRTRNANLYVQGTAETKSIKDDIKLTSEARNRNADVYGLGLNGDWRDNLGGGSVNTYGVAVSSGELRMNAETSALDNLNTKGNYTKTTYNASRLQAITPFVSVYVGANGQFASKNLDSSEKLILGGPNGVRAYGTGEAAGDEGYLATAELRYVVPGLRPFGSNGLQLTTFIDTGRVTLQQDPIAGVRNTRELTGYGFGANLLDNKYTIRAAYAWKGNGSENATATKDDNGRLWLQGVLWF
jgi:hemolysin activation/secretion protein